MQRIRPIQPTLIILALIGTMILAGCTTNTKTSEQKDQTNTQTEDQIKDQAEQPTEEPVQADDAQQVLDNDTAVAAIKNYCHETNPDLQNIEDAGEYPVYWEVESADEKQIVVLFRSYTGAQVRYYIDPASGDTYVTEFVPGITDAEEKTDESFNARDYLQ